MKLVGRLTAKSFEIFRKKIERKGEPAPQYTADQALPKVNYGTSISCQIIRHSNTKLTIVSKRKDEDEESLLLTIDSSYERDIFVLMLRRLNETFSREMGRSGSELREIDFYRRREIYLQR